MRRLYKVLTVLIIIIVTLLTRFSGLNKVPPHLSNDEISIAYDAYSISKTLRDEHNQLLPLYFRSHGDYKAPLTAYITSLSVKVLGNSDFAARFPSALLGSLTVLLIGLVTYQLSKNEKLSFTASFILAITPWHIYTSRMLLETNIALFFLVGGIFFHFYTVNKKIGFLHILSFCLFTLSMYSYHTQLGLTPLLIGSLTLIGGKNLIRKKVMFWGVLYF